MTVVTFVEAASTARSIAVASYALMFCGGLAAVSTRGDEALSAPAIGVVAHAGVLTAVPPAVYDDLRGGSCTLSSGGLLWYRRGAGIGVPIVADTVRCDRTVTLRSVASPPIPAWAKPAAHQPNHAFFAATSLQEVFAPGGMIALHNVAHSERIPMTWLVASWPWVDKVAAVYDRFHRSDRDDVQTAAGIAVNERKLLPWMRPLVAIEGAGHERAIGTVTSKRYIGFWGIAWNSNGTDGNVDLGTPWGAYCADPGSYKHPDARGRCRLVGLEWTARDLTRAYLSEQEAAFSTDPDDLRLRGGFSTEEAQRYVAAVVDAYAAAAQERPLVMTSQQESSEQEDDERTGDRAILQALYHQVNVDGMHAVTLSQAALAARSFAGRPRAIAFPYISGGRIFKTFHCDVSPATIDYHDDRIGLTFIAGKTLPVREFLYDPRDRSSYNIAVATLAPVEFPVLTNVEHDARGLTFHFRAKAATRFGIALWSDPSAIGLQRQAGVERAGRAGAVAVFDLPAGTSIAHVRCSKCDPAALPFSS